MAKAVKTNIEKKILALVLSIGLNLALLGVLFFLNERYQLVTKVERVVLQEGRVPGIAPSYEMNRNYQVRREIFRLDRNEAARVLMLGDSLTAQGEWNAMLGEPLVANRGIDGDTSAGLLARVGDDAGFRGDVVVIWIGTNDVLQGESVWAVVENISKALAELKGRTTKNTNRHEKGEEKAETLKSEKLKKKNLTTKDTNLYKIGKIIDGKIIRTTESTEDTEEESGQRLAGQAGAAFSNPSTSELARDSGNSSLISYADGPASALDAGRSSLDSTKIFVLSVPPMARWWEGAGERNGAIREINAALAASAGAKGFVFVDLQPVLADGDGFLRGDVTSDGVHLNAKGYSVVLEKLKEVDLWPLAED